MLACPTKVCTTEYQILLLKKINPKLKKLLEILNDGRWHDGPSLGQALNISRAAVWKLMGKLSSLGILLEKSVSGYVLKNPPICLLEEKHLNQSLASNRLALEIFESLPSTNDYLKTAAPKNHKIGVCLAEMQTKGKGRLHRTWHSPFGENIYLTLRYPFMCDISSLGGLSLMTSLSVARAVTDYCALPEDSLKLKWPNDVLYQDQKLAGNLIEVVAESHGYSTALIGIGLNVNMMHATLKNSWTSLRRITGTYVDRNPLCATIINYLLEDLLSFEKQGFSAFYNIWVKKDALKSRLVSLECGNQIIAGKAMGISPKGYLLMELPGGDYREFSSGETHIIEHSQAK